MKTEGLNFLEAVTALMEGGCTEIISRAGYHYTLKNGHLISKNTIMDAVMYLSASEIIGKWTLKWVKKKVVFIGVKWHQQATRIGGVLPIAAEGEISFNQLIGKPKMKMTLEWEE